MVLLRGELGSRHIVYPNSSYCVVIVSQLQDLVPCDLVVPEIDLQLQLLCSHCFSVTRFGACDLAIPEIDLLDGNSLFYRLTSTVNL